MATRKAAKTVRKSKTWKDIDQDVRAKSMSSTAFKRMMLARCRKAILFVAVLAGLAGATKLLLMRADFSEALTEAGRALPVKAIETSSDALDREWILDYLDLNRANMNLLSFDLAEMKARLEAYPQVRSAELARELPDTLHISIEEREPVARALAADVERGRVTLLVDREGVVWEGRGYDRKRIDALPYLDGIRLKRDEGRFQRIKGMEVVDDLLSEAQAIAPHLYSSWKVVSLASWPNLVVKSEFAREAVFGANPKGYRRQLSELDYIIDHHKSRSVTRVARVDLTMNSQVPVTQATALR